MPTPFVFREVNHRELVAMIRRSEPVFVCHTQVHPNDDKSVAMRLDTGKIRDVLDFAREHRLQTGGLDFIELVCGLHPDERLIKRMLKNAYQLARGEECEVKFYRFDFQKMQEIDAWEKKNRQRQEQRNQHG